MNSAAMTANDLEKLGDWYHRIDLGDGRFTPGDRNQALTFALYEPHLPDLAGKTVLDLGANACGLSIEFAKRGAHVTAIERADQYIKQARFIVDHFGLTDRVSIHKADAHEMTRFGRFDIVVCVGLIYHMRHPQLALDQLSHVAKGPLLISTQTMPGNDFIIRSRGAARDVYTENWEPTERSFMGMLCKAGFTDVRCLSTKPHAGESPGNILGNRSYFLAEFARTALLPKL